MMEILVKFLILPALFVVLMVLQRREDRRQGEAIAEALRKIEQGKHGTRHED